MKKSLVFVAATCVCALALHADFNYSNNVFRAIGAGASITDLKSVNGTWRQFETSDGEITWADSSLAFDLEDGKSIAFTVSDGAAPDTNTVVKVEVKGVFTPVVTNDFPSTADMNTRRAQVGFVIGINTTESTTNYYAWAGSNWTPLSAPAAAAPDADGETDLVATFNYMTNNYHFVSFDIVNGSATNRLTTTVGGLSALRLTSSAGANSNNVAGISCYGSGKLKSADGSVGLGVATLSDGVKYGSIADAVAAAGTSVTTVTVVRATSDGATINGSNITISDPGKQATGTISVAEGATVHVAATIAELDGGTNGVYSIPLKMSGGTVIVELPATVAEYKEVATSNVTLSAIEVTLQTKSSIVRAIAPDGSTALSANEAKLREFLNTYTNEAYAAANATSESLANALRVSGLNGIPLWQSYVLGIAPTNSIAPVTAPAGDTAADGITLAIPAIDTSKYSGDYTVTYQVGTSETNNPQAIKAPLATGKYTIKAVLTPKSVTP